MDSMRILFAWPSAEYSTFDVGTGYRDALKKIDGIQIENWLLFNRIKLMYRAMDLEQSRENLAVVSYQACKMIVGDALETDCDWVLIVSAMAFHPNALLLLKKIHKKIAVIFTESPYDDGDLDYFAQFCDVVFTNDLYSANTRGWQYLPAAYNPAIHCPGPSDAPPHDVVVVGTGWDDRVKLLHSMDWQDIDLGIYGFWPQLAADQEAINLREAVGMAAHEEARKHLSRYVDEPTTNEETVDLYRNAKICINDHRKHSDALSCNPRVYEVLATGGGLLLTDYRKDLENLLGDRLQEFLFDGSEDLQSKIHYYLTHEDKRQELVAYGRERVSGHTFEVRAQYVTQMLKAV